MWETGGETIIVPVSRDIFLTQWWILGKLPPLLLGDVKGLPSLRQLFLLSQLFELRQAHLLAS